MNWRIIGFSSYGPDYQKLSAQDRLLLDEELFGWVADGPPRSVSRTMFGVEGYEDVTPSGFRITYLVSEADGYVAVLRVRKETLPHEAPQHVQSVSVGPRGRAAPEEPTSYRLSPVRRGQLHHPPDLPGRLGSSSYDGTHDEAHDMTGDPSGVTSGDASPMWAYERS